MREYSVAADRRRAPTHPGEILREDVLPELKMSVSEAARLGKFCGNGPGLWLRMQQAYDLWHAERQLRAELEKTPARGVAA